MNNTLTTIIIVIIVVVIIIILYKKLLEKFFQKFSIYLMSAKKNQNKKFKQTPFLLSLLMLFRMRVEITP